MVKWNLFQEFNKLKNLLFIFLILFSTLSFSKGMSGYYFIEGKAYSANETILKNALLNFQMGEHLIEFKTDEDGKFKVKIPWRTPCRSGLSNKAAEKITKEINPNESHFGFKCQGTMVKNYWRDFQNAQYDPDKSNVQKLDLYFRN